MTNLIEEAEQQVADEFKELALKGVKKCIESISNDQLRIKQTQDRIQQCEDAKHKILDAHTKGDTVEVHTLIDNIRNYGY